MNIIWKGAHPNNYGINRGGKTINKVVMHWIVGTLSSADATFLSSSRKASAHYGVGPTEVHQYVNEKDTAWHASSISINQESIGIEHEGGHFVNGVRLKPVEATLKNSAELLASVCKRYNIPLDRDHIKLHKEVRPPSQGTTECPGTLDVDRIILLAKGVMAPPQDVITDQTKIPQIVDANGNQMEVQAIRSKLNDQDNSIRSKDARIRELEAAVQVPAPAPFTKPKAIHFNELAKLEEAV